MPDSREIALQNQEHFAYARDRGHLEFLRKADKCDDYIANRQWDEEVAAKLDRAGKPVITINKTLTSLAAVMGEQLAVESDTSFRSASGGNPETAAALDKVWINFSQNNNLEWLKSEMAADGFIRSRGFIDMRMRWNDNFKGDIQAKLVNSKNVVIDPDADTYDPDDWSQVFLTKWMNVQTLGRQYGKRFERELKARPESAFTNNYDMVDWEPDNFGGNALRDVYSQGDNNLKRMYRIVERQFKDIKNVECFLNPETGDMREIPDNWEHNRVNLVLEQYGWKIYRKEVEKIRWTVTVDDIVLFNDVSPYKHFTPIPFFPFFRYGTTIGIVENMLSPQDLLNKSTSQELHIVTQTANSGWIVKHGELMNMTLEELEDRGGEDGLVISINGNPKTDIEKIKPNQVPTGLDRISYKADEFLKETSMVSDSMRGFDRADVAAKAIQEKKQSGLISMAKPFSNLEFSQWMIARNFIDLVQAYMTEERVLQITSTNPLKEDEEVVVNQVTPEGNVVNDLTLGEYRAVIVPTSTRDTFEEGQFDSAMRMREAGIAIPDANVVQNSPLVDKADLVQTLKARDGMADPTESEKRMAEIDEQLKVMEAQEKEADIALKNAQAQLAQAKAASEGTGGAPGQGQGPDEAALVKVASDRELALKKIQNDAEQARRDRELEWRKHASTMKLEHDKIDANLEMKSAEKKSRRIEE